MKRSRVNSSKTLEFPRSILAAYQKGQQAKPAFPLNRLPANSSCDGWKEFRTRSQGVESKLLVLL